MSDTLEAEQNSSQDPGDHGGERETTAWQQWPLRACRMTAFRLKREAVANGQAGVRLDRKPGFNQ